MAHYRDQLERIDRLMPIIQSSDQWALSGNLNFEDIVMFTCQSMWHLKDWIVNDPDFHPADASRLVAEIHSTRCLLICADLANGSKHALLSRPKVGGRIFEHQGMRLDTARDIHQTLFYVVTDDETDEYHGMEIRPFLERCRAAWQVIIDRHYLSAAKLALGYPLDGA